MDGWEALADGHGVFSTAEAMSAGFTARDLRQLVRSDAVVRLDRGWYGLTEALSSDPDSPWERRRRQHALRARAIIRGYESPVVASHHTGLAVPGLPVFAADLRQVHATRVDAGQFRRRAGLTVHERSNGLQAVEGVIDLRSAIMGDRPVQWADGCACRGRRRSAPPPVDRRRSCVLG